MIRQVLAQHTTEEIAASPKQLAAEIENEASESLTLLGLQADSMVIVGRHEAIAQELDAELDKLGIASLSLATEISCDIPRNRGAASARIEDGILVDVEGELPAAEPLVLRNVGRAVMTCGEGVARVRWPSAPVTSDQLVAGAKFLALFRDQGAYR